MNHVCHDGHGCSGPVGNLTGRRSGLIAAISLVMAALGAPPARGEPAGTVALTATPPEITYALEADPPASSRLQLTVTGRGAGETRLIRLASNLGAISAPRRNSSGWEADFTPPDLEKPAVALIRAEVDRDGAREVHWVSVPISVRESMTFAAPAGSIVVVRLGSQEFGPAKAPSGQATLAVDVGPGATSLTVVITPPRGEPRITHQPLKRSSFARIALAVPDRAVAGETVAIHAYVVDASGRPFTQDLPALRITASETTLVQHTGKRSAQRFLIRLPPQSGALTIKVAMPQETGVEAEIALDVSRARRVRLELEVDPPNLQVGSGQTALVTVRAKDAEGGPIDPEDLQVTAAGRPLAMSRVTEGEYRGFLYAPTGRGVSPRIALVARAQQTPEVRHFISIDGGPATELAIRVGQAQVLADGHTGVTFEVEARDRFGLPAAERELRTEVEHGTLDYLHRIRPGRFRGRFVPGRSTVAGRATIAVSTATVRPVTGEVRLLPVSQRWFLVPTVGMLSNLGRMLGPQVGLRAELAVFRRRPLVVLGLEGQLAVANAALGVDLPEHEAWGISGGLLFSTRIRAVAAGRFGLDVVLDLGVLGVGAWSHIRRNGDHVDPVSEAHAAFTVSAGLDAAVLTRNQSEVLLFARVRYLTASYDDGSMAQSAAFVLGIGYRFAL
jgi:hypothetical protein